MRPDAVVPAGGGRRGPGAAPGAALRLARPWNAALAASAAMLGGWLGGTPAGDPVLLRAALATALVACAGYVLNDLLDVDRDRVNHPHRPIAAGLVPPGEARAMAVMLAALGLGLAWSAGPAVLALALGWCLALAAYEGGLKQREAWGNLVVSAVSASAFLAGGLVSRDPAAAWVPALFAFLYHLARELWKDAEDVAGDAATGARTIAVRHGARRGLASACAVFGLLVVLSPVPYFTGLYNGRYLATVLGGVDLLLVAMIILAVTNPTRTLASRTQGVLKLGMALGMCAIALGRLSR